MERIAKFISRCGVASRRKSEELIRGGNVAVNGTITREVGLKVDPLHDVVTVGNNRLKLPLLKYFLFHKPEGVITTKKDTHSRKTVMDFFPKQHKDIHPVGRLDKDTTGVLLMTNDGELTNFLTHPRYGVAKTYEIIISDSINSHDLKRLQKGIVLEDGLTQPAEIIKCTRKKNTSMITIRIKEGKKRQVKRMFYKLGYRVIKLKRLSFGPLSLGNLKEGKYRELNVLEITKLRGLVHETG